VGLPVRVGRGEDDRLPPDVLGLEGGDRGHAADVCSGENAKRQGGNGSVAHGSPCGSETGYRSTGISGTMTRFVTTRGRRSITSFRSIHVLPSVFHIGADCRESEIADEKHVDHCGSD
jgi:hypothetical protein